MNLVMSLDHNVPFAPNGPFQIVGNGSDDVGAFEIKGTVTKVNADGSGGAIGFVKIYSSSQWEYQGRYDGKGNIEGTWGGGDTSGSFQLTQTANLTVDLAAPLVKMAVRGLPCSPDLASAVEVASRNSSGVTPANVLTLLNAFTS